MKSVIAVNNLVREYETAHGIFRKKISRVNAVNDISFDVKEGEIFGLLGQNGAGKTTTIKILTTLLVPTKGEAKVLGYDVTKEARKIRAKINLILGSERNLYWRLSGKDNLRYFADLYKLNKPEKKIDELLELVGLKEYSNKKVETYSKGMKQRLQIARGLINDPDVIFLDEPTIGLDPVGAIELRSIIKQLSEAGKTILFTTHYMYEADELCNRIAIMNKGKIVCSGEPNQLKCKYQGFCVIEIKILGLLDGDRIKLIKLLKGIISVEVSTIEQIQVLKIQCDEPSNIINKVIDALKYTVILSINYRETTLEDTYIRIVSED